MPGEEFIGQMAAKPLTDAFNIWKDGMMNKAQQKWAIAMYNRQRSDALADWQRENDYNSPSGQMARLKEARLNPNLVYGNGATATGGDIRGTNAGQPEFRVGNKSQQGDDLMQYHNIQLQEAQIDNLRAQNTAITNEAALKAEQTAGARLDNRKKEFDYGFESETRPYSLEARKLANDKTAAEIKLTLNRDEREEAMNSASIQEAAERILTMRSQRSKNQVEKRHLEAQIKNIQADTKLKDYEKKLNDEGMTKGDSKWWRMLNNVVRDTSGGIPGQKLRDKADEVAPHAFPFNKLFK